jgi:hypothetical protein
MYQLLLVVGIPSTSTTPPSPALKKPPSATVAPVKSKYTLEKDHSSPIGFRIKELANIEICPDSLTSASRPFDYFSIPAILVLVVVVASFIGTAIIFLPVPGVSS